MNHPIEALIANSKGDLKFLTEEPYNMTVREEFSENGKGVWVVDYCQINSPRLHPVVDECRGIVICRETLKVVCWPFRRFYNLGEYPENEKSFDWKTAHCSNKEDGSLIKTYFFDGKWRIATRGTAFGNNTITNLIGESCEISFRDLFLRAIGMDYRQFQLDMSMRYREDCNVFFELCTKENRVVTRYEQDKVFCLGIRGANDPAVAPMTQVLCVHYFLCPAWAWTAEEHPMSTFDEALHYTQGLKDLKEGLVLCDGNGKRLKVKSPTYVIAHHVRGNSMNGKRAVDLIVMNEHHEFISYFPEYEEFIMKFSERLDKLKSDCGFYTYNLKDVESQKDFAMAVKDLPFSGILFSMRKGISFDVVFDKLTTNSKYRVLGAD